MNALLRIAELLDNTLRYRDPNAAVSVPFSQALNTEFESPDFYMAIGTLIEQFEREARIVLEQETHERAQAIYSRSIDAIRPWLHPHTIRSQTVATFKQVEAHVDQLHVMGSRLTNRDDTIEPAVVESAIRDAQDLQETLSHLDIDPELKLYLLRLVDTLIMALRSVDTIGVEGLNRVFGAFASELARASGPITNAEAHDWVSTARKWAGRLAKGALWTTAFISSGSNAITDVSDVINLIAGPKDNQDK